MSGKYENNGLNGTLPVGEVTGVSETFERLSSAELVDDDPHDPIRKMVSTQKSVKLIRRTNKAFFISYTHKLPYLGSDHILQNNFFTFLCKIIECSFLESFRYLDEIETFLKDRNSFKSK